MNAIKMERAALLKIVQENKAKHVADFLEAQNDYKALILQLAQANLKIAKSADLEEFKKIKNPPSAPVSHEKEYARAERMLELSVDEFIEVEEDVFNQLVLDEWAWKHNFLMSNTMYKAGASAF